MNSQNILTKVFKQSGDRTGAPVAAAPAAAAMSVAAAPPPPTPAPHAHGHGTAGAWRSELFIKKGEPLAAQAAALLRPSPVNVVNKQPREDHLGALAALRAADPLADVCLHYSMVRAPWLSWTA
jgi:hypothetical protein